MSVLPVQVQPFSLSGSGAIIGATSITLKSFLTIDGVQLTLADFGTKGYMTMEPGNTTQEEQISFTGVTLNGNGTTSLTGVKTVSFLSPYTETSGLAKTHAGSTTVVVSNTSGFYSNFTGIQSGAAAPASTPTTIGQMYIDTVAEKVYVSTGTSSSANWKILN